MTEPVQIDERRVRIAQLAVKADEARLRQQGADDSAIISLFTQTANDYIANKRFIEAEAYLLRLLKIVRHIQEEDNFYVLLLIKKIVSFYRMQGRYSETEPLIKRSLEAWRRMGGDEHPNVGLALNDLAVLHHREGKLSEAEDLYLQAFPIIKALKSNHPDAQNVRNNFKALIEQAIAEDRVSELSNDPLTQSAIQGSEVKPARAHHYLRVEDKNIVEELTKFRMRYGEKDGQEAFIAHLLEQALRHEMKNLTSIALKLVEEADLYKNEKRFLTAEECIKRAIKVCENDTVEEDMWTIARYRLACFYAEQSRYSEAETTFLSAVASPQALKTSDAVMRKVDEDFVLFVGLVVRMGRKSELSNHPLTKIHVDTWESQGLSG